MSGKRRNYSYLKKNISSTEFKDFCRKIANQYANSEGHFSYSYFCEKENITKSCFYRVIEEAVIMNWVSEDTVNKIEAKSIFNQKYHAQNAGGTTLRKYAELRKKRNKYIISLYSNEEIKNIAKEFAENFEVTKKDFAKKYDISIVVLDTLLRKAFVENIADDEICKAIEERSIQKDSSKRAKKFFEQLWKQRKCPA